MSATASYHTVQAAASAEYKDKGSRFLALLHPVASMAAADELLRQYRATYADASHVCYALRAGASYRASDAGEPAHSAGAPIYRVLLSAGLTHALLVVVRWFGGTKLGVPGLIHAYGEAARLAVAAAQVVPYVPQSRLLVHYTYPQTAAWNRLLAAHHLHPSHQTYEDICTAEVLVPAHLVDHISHDLNQLTEWQLLPD